MTSLKSAILTDKFIKCLTTNVGIRCYFWKKESTDEPTPIVQIVQNINDPPLQRSIQQKIPYQPPQNVENTCKKVFLGYISDESAFNVQSSFPDIKTKFKILTKLINILGKDVNNNQLLVINNYNDVLNFFLTPVDGDSPLEKLANRPDLPGNVTIELDPVRFDPETDKYFNGQTAYPGSNTIVKSIKYSHKYKSIKTTKVAPGYFNHYRGY